MKSLFFTLILKEELKGLVIFPLGLGEKSMKLA
jgi:hypothetical protein